MIEFLNRRYHELQYKYHVHSLKKGFTRTGLGSYLKLAQQLLSFPFYATSMAMASASYRLNQRQSSFLEKVFFGIPRLMLYAIGLASFVAGKIIALPFTILRAPWKIMQIITRSNNNNNWLETVDFKTGNIGTTARSYGLLTALSRINPAELKPTPTRLVTNYTYNENSPLLNGLSNFEAFDTTTSNYIKDADPGLYAFMADFIPIPEIDWPSRGDKKETNTFQERKDALVNNETIKRLYQNGSDRYAGLSKLLKDDRVFYLNDQKCRDLRFFKRFPIEIEEKLETKIQPKP